MVSRQGPASKSAALLKIFVLLLSGVSDQIFQELSDELIALSISPSLIKIEAKGSSQPKYFESMPSGEAANRRAEIFIVQSSS